MTEEKRLKRMKTEEAKTVLWTGVPRLCELFAVKVGKRNRI